MSDFILFMIFGGFMGAAASLGAVCVTVLFLRLINETEVCLSVVICGLIGAVLGVTSQSLGGKFELTMICIFALLFLPLLFINFRRFRTYTP